MNELLDTYKPLSVGQPPTVSHWSDHNNDKTLRKNFKMIRQVVKPDDFIAHYLFGGNVKMYKYMTHDCAREIDLLHDFLERSTSYININELDLFLPADIPHDLFRRKIHDKLMSRSAKIEMLDGLNFAEEYRQIATGLQTNLSKWVYKLATTLRMSPDDVPESTYEDVFRRYLEVFNLVCVNGNAVKIGIPYRDTYITTVPNLLIRRNIQSSRYCGVVEVKKMTLDPKMKHAFSKPPKKGILSDSTEEPKAKRSCVNFQPEEGASVSRDEEEAVEGEAVEGDTVEGNTVEVEADQHQSALNMIGSPLTDFDEEFVKLFFGQLFGSVLALDCCFPHGINHPQQRLGIGVVGFRVVFLGFFTRPASAFNRVLSESSRRMDVFMTPQLSLLNASDRKEIAKILLALSTNDP